MAKSPMKFTKEQLIASAHSRIEFAEMMLTGELEPLKERTWSIELELARIAMASLEADSNINNHPAHAPLTTRRLHQMRDILSKAAAQRDGGDIGYAMSDAVKLIDEVLAVKSAPLMFIDGNISPEDAEKLIAAIEEFNREPRDAQVMIAEPVNELYKLPVIGWLRSDFNSDDRRDPNAPLFVLGSNDPSEVWKVKYIPLTGNSPVIPEGWVMVPKELTCEMDYAAWEAYHETRNMSDIWEALLSAAPKQEVK